MDLEFVAAQRRSRSTTASAYNRKFDTGKDGTAEVAPSKPSQPGEAQRRVIAEFPNWMLESLDCNTKRLGVIRQSFIELRIAE